eukprot:3748596-Rhodomonas_salina.2
MPSSAFSWNCLCLIGACAASGTSLEPSGWPVGCGAGGPLRLALPRDWRVQGLALRILQNHGSLKRVCDGPP